MFNFFFTRGETKPLSQWVKDLEADHTNMSNENKSLKKKIEISNHEIEKLKNEKRRLIQEHKEEIKELEGIS